MKTITKIFIILSLGLLLFIPDLFAGYEITGGSKVGENSMDIETNSDIATTVENVGLSALETFKVVIQTLIVIFIVYIGAQMIMYMGNDDEKLSGAKRQLRYSLIAILFVNIPGSIYRVFNPENIGTLNKNINNNTFTSDSTEYNLFINTLGFEEVVNGQIIGFLKILIFMIAVITIMLAGFKIMTARGREEKIKEAKQKIVYSVIGIVFLGVIEAWKNFAFDGSIEDGKNLFADLANLALFFAGPIAIIFITMAGYYYITANGDEEKIKKAKSIIINTILATLILLASYTFLLDIATLFG